MGEWVYLLIPSGGVAKRGARRTNLNRMLLLGFKMMRVSILGLLVAALALAPVAHAGWNELVFVGQGGDAPSEVTVELSGMPYEEGNVLSVVVKNGLGQTIWGTNGQTDCSMVTL